MVISLCHGPLAFGFVSYPVHEFLKLLTGHFVGSSRLLDLITAEDWRLAPDGTKL